MKVIAESYSGKYRFGLFGTEGKKELQKFTEAQGCASYVGTKGAWQEAQDVGTVGALYVQGANVVRFATAPWRSKLLWKTHMSDGQECVVEATILVEADSTRFLDVWLGEICAAEKLTSDSVDGRLRAALEVDVVDEMKKQTFDGLTRDLALPTDWWTVFFKRSVAGLGLTFDSVVDVQYSAPSIEKENELKKREEERRELIERKEFEARFEIRLAEIEAEKNERKREIEQNAFISAASRQEERRRVEAEAEKSKIELGRKAELSRLEYEKKRLELEQAIDEVKRKPEEREALEEKIEQVGASVASLTQQIDEKFQRSSESNLTPQLAAYLSGISDKVLFKLNLHRDKAFFSRNFNDKALRSPVIARLERGFLTRDVKYKKDVPTLRIDDSIAMEIVSPIDGYVSILNLGTSGKYWLLTPNGLVAPKDAFINKGESVRAPGGALYPDEMYEGGPEGWEEFVVLVSKEPLFDGYERFNLVDRENPFAELSTERLNRLLEQLETLDENDWAVGTVGVNVVRA